MKKFLAIFVFSVCVSPALFGMGDDEEKFLDVKKAEKRELKTEMQEQLLEAAFLVQDIDFLLGLCRNKKIDITDQKACLKVWKNFARTLDQDINNNEIRSQEDLSYEWADLAQTRAQVKSDLARLHESNGLTPDWQDRGADYKGISDDNDEPLCPGYDQLCLRFELARSIDKYIIRAQELVAKIEQLQNLLKNMPSPQSTGLNMHELNIKKQDWQRDIKSYKRKKKRRDFTSLTHSEIADLQLIMSKNEKIRDDLLCRVKTWVNALEQLEFL